MAPARAAISWLPSSQIQSRPVASRSSRARSSAAIRPTDFASWKLSPSSTTAAGDRASISASSRSSVARLS